MNSDQSKYRLVVPNSGCGTQDSGNTRFNILVFQTDSVVQVTKEEFDSPSYNFKTLFFHQMLANEYTMLHQ